jgi:serine protease
MDTPAGTQWYLHQCKVPETDKVAPVVAVVDFGFRTTHEELKSLNLTEAFNTCDLSQKVDWPGDVYHGTGTAGLLAAVVNGIGMQGVAPGTEVWPIQGTCPTTPIGIPWATAVERVRAAGLTGRRKVVLLEVQTGEQENFESDPAVNIAIQTAVADGVIVVLPAGNRGIDASETVSKADIPASGAIVVGATAYGNPDEALAWSNFGDRVVVWAPGDPSYDLTISDESDTAYTPALGYTSGAAPKVAGVVAMMLTLNETLTPAEVVEALSAGPAMTGQSGKQLDAQAALESARTK